MPLFQRFRHRSHPFHITDVENLYGAVRDGNHGAALRGSLMILNGAVNGPHLRRDMIGTEVAGTIPTGEHDWTPADEEKATKLADEMAKMIGVKMDESGNRVMEGTAISDHGDVEETGTHRKGAKGRKKATEAKEDETEAEDEAGGTHEPQARFEGGVVGAVPWALVVELVFMVIQYLKNRQM